MYGDLAVGTSGPEPTGLAVDDVGLHPSLGLVSNSKFLARVAGESINENIDGRKDLVKDASPFFRTEVQRQAALMAIQEQMYRAVMGSHLSTQFPQVVTDPRLLDLYALGAQVSENASSLVAGGEDRAFEDPDALQKLDHVAPDALDL
jgi:hypothetical protein